MEKVFQNDKKYKDVKVGTKFGFERKISYQDIKKFGTLVKDSNPLHLKTKSAEYRQDEVISHGMFIGSLTAPLLGTHCPINNNVLVSISLNFRKSVFSNDKITIEGTVISKSDAQQILIIKIQIYKEQQIFVEGEAIIKVLQ